MQSARSRHYYDDYQVRMRSKMLKRRTREEMVGVISDISHPVERFQSKGGRNIYAFM